MIPKACMGTTRASLEVERPAVLAWSRNALHKTIPLNEVLRVIKTNLVAMCVNMCAETAVKPEDCTFLCLCSDQPQWLC